MISSAHSTIRRTPQTKPSFAGLRRYNRRVLATDVVVQDADGWEIPLESADISPTGMFVRSEFLFGVGDEHTLIFHIEGHGVFRLHGRVARVEAPDDGQMPARSSTRPGMGYEFVKTGEQTWQELCAAVAG